MITNRGAKVLLAGTLVAFGWAANHALPSGPPSTFVIHVEYGAEEDMVACPGTPGRVVSYSSLPDGGALIECRTADLP